MAYTKYSLTPANNNAAPPDGAPEGMLPSAVNDTMRDMMAQIRDVGDGIRGGTYTMTAPVITGGSINGTTVGAGTASTGAFTTLGASGVATFSAGTVSAPAITTTGDTNTGIFFPAADTIAFTEGGVESMRIDASGILSVGTTATVNDLNVPVQLNSVSGFQRYFGANRGGSYGLLVGYDYNSDIARIRNIANTAMTFETNNTERMRIDSSGRVMVGVTSSNNKFTISGGAGGSNFTFNADNPNATSGDYNTVLGLGANTNNTASYFLLCTQPGVANRFAIYGNGTFGTISDVRLKKNIDSARDGYLDDLLKLRVVKYNWNTQEDGETKELGLIAQETEQVFAGLIQEAKAPNSEIAYKQIKTSVLPFMLLKAIQEQQAMIETLTTRLNALEGK